MNNNDLMEKIVSLAKRRGFVYPASELYGGLANSFDYGPLGSQMKKNIKDVWWREFVTKRDDIVGLDSAIIQNPRVWEASGHLKSFSDPLVECKKCHQRFRADHVEEVKGMAGSELTTEQKAMIVCPAGGEHEFTEAKDFNLMFKTFIGVTEDTASVAYLRPETAQGIFTNFENVLQSTRVKIPFGIAQIGKAFRNEITPGNFIFRTREFEQAEIEYFIKPDDKESSKWYEYWIEKVKSFYLDLGMKKENLLIREHEKSELSHYSTGTSDIEYRFPFGVSELAGIAQRTDYDLKQHEQYSGQELKYYDDESRAKYVPYVVEPSMGIDRAMLAFLVDAYDESNGSDGRAAGEVTLRLHPKLAPIKAAVFPLVKKEGLPDVARSMVDELRRSGIMVFYDESGSVGRRYRRQDEIGTPWCITVDFQTLEDETVTVRDRDTMKQERVAVKKIATWINERLEGVL
ncbi:MAG: Glycine--tRNA ligase [bacterium ADurb.Bin400]|nr:MAG: Glycine--tRNA ligase [bacterium ADurb.Bin400]